MIRLFSRPMPLVLLLAFATFIPVMMAGIRVVQIPAGLLPGDSLRLHMAPVSHWLHALAGALFGVLGPMQFARALRARFGALHRLSGRVFVVAGLVMALSGLGLLLRVESIATPLLYVARAVFSAGLVVALALGVRAARLCDRGLHRAWMIRAYAIGMGGATVALVMFPIYLTTGAPVTGLTSDLVFVGWWLVTIAIGEWVIKTVGKKELTA
ncbi:MAG: DUF2306 domain-containing protein [Pseudorhodobacter sp.]